MLESTVGCVDRVADADVEAAGVAASGRRGAACELEARLVALARGPVALRRALARVAGRMLATRGWERLGFARLEDYAAERAGASARELRELAAVDRALAELRGLEAAYLAGRLGWTQLRLLCRVATPEDQVRWLALAEQLPARALAREVRAVDRQARAPGAEAPESTREREGVVLRISRRTQARWWRARGLAARVAGHALSHAQFAELLAAEVASAVPLDGELGPPPEPEERRPRVAAGPAAQLRPLPPISPPPADREVLALERDLERADAFALDARLRRGLALEARQLARVAALLHQVAAHRLYRDAGFNGLDAYAEERLGLSASRARALLRVERAARECPAIAGAFRSGRLGWVRVDALLALWREPGAAEQREGWVAHAERVSVRRLREDVERAVALADFSVPSLDATRPAGVQTGAIPRSPEEDAHLFFSAPPEVTALFRAVLAVAQRRLERLCGHPCTRSAALEAMLDHAVAAWQPEYAPPREHAVFERDGWRCTAPGCTSYRDLHQHHVVFRSQGGGDEPENLTTLCAWHHLRGVHAGRVRCTGRAPDGLRFELGLRAGSAPAAVYEPGEVRVR